MKRPLKKSTLRFGVVGAGMMGRNHLRVLSSLRGVEIAAVVEPDRKKRALVADAHGCLGLESVEELIGRVDAVCVVSPTGTHGAIGRKLLGAGIHCLIEKPLAGTEAECKSLIAASEKTGVTLLAGHIERFNPAVSQLVEILRGGAKIYAADVRRMSAASSRISDVDVVMDLMVHDIDIVLAMMRSPVVSVTARGVRSSGLKGMDYVAAILAFKNGSVASLSASRITENRVREMLVTSDIGCIALDYTAQRIAIYKQRGPEVETRLGNYQFDLSMGRVLVRPGEPLVLELMHFIDCIRNGKSPLIGGADALDALRLVWKIQEQCRSR
jgi:predicted dehydrogenase